MQENNEQIKNVSNVTSSKNSKVDKKEKSKSFFGETKSEFKKITWPTRKILTKQTITVIILSLIVGVIIFGYDLGIDFIIENLTKFVTWLEVR